MTEMLQSLNPATGDLVGEVHVTTVDSVSAVVEQAHEACRHFALEELYMVQLEYPGREAHVNAHDQFREEIFALIAAEDELDITYREIIATFLTEWLRHHVFGTDKQLESYLLKNGVK